MGIVTAVIFTLEAGSSRPAVAVQELAIDPAPLGRAQEAHEMGAVLRQAHPPPGDVLSELGHLAGGHPARIGRAGIHDVRRDAEVPKLPGRRLDDAVQGSLARAVRQIVDDVIASERDDPAAAAPGAGCPPQGGRMSPETPAELPYN